MAMVVGEMKPTFRTDPRRNNADQELAEIRQGVLEGLHRSIDDAQSSQMFPSLLVEAVANEIWAHPRQMAYTLAPVMPLDEFVVTPFPRGMGTTMETVRKLIAGNKKAELAWDRAVRGTHGRINAPRDPETGRLVKTSTAPVVSHRRVAAGNSAQGGMRRLDKAAQAGDEKAAGLLRQVLAGTTTINRACIDMGWRKGMTPVDTIRRAWDRAAPSERHEFLRFVRPLAAALAETSP
jgi:hypothetical protein